MSFFVRKIARGKWPEMLTKRPSLPADSFTDLNTKGNVLSVWEISDKDLFEDAVLAFASKCEYISTMDFVMIEAEDVCNLGNPIKFEPGITNYKVFTDNHRNIMDLTYESIGAFAELVHSRILDSGYYKRFTQMEIFEILKNALESHKIDFNSLNGKMKEDIQQRLKKTG